MKQTPAKKGEPSVRLTHCNHDGDPCDSLAWAFWKAQRQLVELNLKLAHVKKQLKGRSVSCDDKDDD